MAKTKQEFIAEGRASYAKTVAVTVTGGVPKVPAFGEGDSWQAKAFAEGWRIEYHLDRDRQEQEARKLGEQVNRPFGEVLDEGRAAVAQRKEERASEQRRGMRIEAMVRGYTSALLFFENDEEGEPLGEGRELADSARDKAYQVCAAFYDKHHIDLGAYAAHPGAQNRDCADPYELAGHDLWLTTNNHGTGFWDRGMGGIGQRLNVDCGYAGTFKPRDAYVGDDGLVYLDN